MTAILAPGHDEVRAEFGGLHVQESRERIGRAGGSADRLGTIRARCGLLPIACLFDAPVTLGNDVPVGLAG